MPGQAGATSFKVETLIGYRAEQRLPIGDRQAFCASQQQALDLSNLMPCPLNVGSFLISSDLIASQLLLEIAHCIPLSPQSVSPHRISNSSHLTSCQLGSPHLISSHLKSSLPCSALLSWSQLFSSLLMSPELFSSLLFSPQLISA